MRLSIVTRKIGSDNKDSIKTDFLNVLFTNTHVFCFLWSFHIRNLPYGKVFYLLNYGFIIFSVWFLLKIHCTQKVRFFIKDSFSKCDQINRKLRIFPKCAYNRHVSIWKPIQGCNRIIWSNDFNKVSIADGSN